MSTLENLRAPCHADGDRGTEAKPDHEKTTVSGPAVVKGEGGGEEAGDLDAYCASEEDCAEAVETI